MDHADTLAAARIRRLLEREPIVWLSTVRPDGTPHIVPIWFWWDGEAVLIFSKPDAQKVRNLRAGSSVMLGVGDPDGDFDIGLFKGHAELLETPTAEVMPPSHVAKYAARMASVGMTTEDYVTTYSQVIRIVPDVFLPWHGRTTSDSTRLAGAPTVSLDESSSRPGLRSWVGEPLARGLRAFGAGRLRPTGSGAL